MAERVAAVEKKPRRTTGTGGPSPGRGLSPDEMSARIAALRLERDKELVISALKARGEAVDPSVNARDLRARYTDSDWQDLIAEGKSLPG